MKELTSIYVSLFLVFSPLFGQTKQAAIIYMTSGSVGKVIVLEIGEDAIEVELISSDGQWHKQTIQKYMIYKLLSPDGNSLYTNPDTKEEYEKTFQEFKVKKSQSEQLMRSSEYAMNFGSEREYIEYRMSSINDVSITTFSNEIIVGKIFTMTDSSLAICKFDSCYDWRTHPVLSFDYSEINKLVVMKKSQRRKGAKIGFLVGAAIGAVVGYAEGSKWRECEGFECIGTTQIPPFIVAIIFGIVYGTPGAFIGGILGSNQDEHYQINGNIQAFKKLHKKIDDEVIFYELPEDE